METIGVFAAKTHLSALIDKVMNSGHGIIITKRGKPVARLVPYHDKNRAAQAAAKLKELRKKNTLGGISWKELRDAGRR